jgi:hypothetical protein
VKPEKQAHIAASVGRQMRAGSPLVMRACLRVFSAQGDVLVALGKIQASALDFLRAATPFAAPGVGGTVPAPAQAAAPSGAPTAAAPQAAVPAPAAAPAGRRNLVHKTHRTHTVSAPL